MEDIKDIKEKNIDNNEIENNELNSNKTENKELDNNKTENKEKEKNKNKKSKINVEHKKTLSDDELKEKINKSYLYSNKMNNIIKQAVDNIVSKYNTSILDLINFADNSLKLKKYKDSNNRIQYKMEYDLTNEQLEFLAIKIPVVCLYIQEFINYKSLDSTIAEYIVESTITEKLKNLRGGDAKERLRFAQQESDIEYFVSIIKKQIYINLKSYIDRADKIYDGVKKVLDGKNREKGMFMKSNQYSS